jgi:hypothetical protein
MSHPPARSVEDGFNFLRRIFEVSFVNSYSRPTPLRALVIIAFLYGGVAASCAFFQVRTFRQPTFQPIFILGILIVAFGEVLNGYHHWLWLVCASLACAFMWCRAMACLAG